MFKFFWIDLQHASINSILPKLSTDYTTLKCVNYANDNHSQYIVNDNHYQ